MKTEEDLGFDLSSFAEDLESKTLLSEREAELYILMDKGDLNAVEASNVMDISSNNAYGKLGIIRDKIGKAERTAELDI